MSRRFIVILATLYVVLAVGGCFVKTIIVPKGQPVRIREEIQAKVWVEDDEGAWVESIATIPAGWYAIPNLEETEASQR